MHLLVCYLNQLQNTRCNDKDVHVNCVFVVAHVVKGLAADPPSRDSYQVCSKKDV